MKLQFTVTVEVPEDATIADVSDMYDEVKKNTMTFIEKDWVSGGWESLENVKVTVGKVRIV